MSKPSTQYIRALKIFTEQDPLIQWDVRVDVFTTFCRNLIQGTLSLDRFKRAVREI